MYSDNNNKNINIMLVNFENFKVGTKVQSYDKDGYYVMKCCGFIAKHLGGGHAIIKGFDGEYNSTVFKAADVVEIELLD